MSSVPNPEKAPTPNSFIGFCLQPAGITFCCHRASGSQLPLTAFAYGSEQFRAETDYLRIVQNVGVRLINEDTAVAIQHIALQCQNGDRQKSRINTNKFLCVLMPNKIYLDRLEASLYRIHGHADGIKVETVESRIRSGLDVLNLLNGTDLCDLLCVGDSIQSQYQGIANFFEWEFRQTGGNKNITICTSELYTLHASIARGATYALAHSSSKTGKKLNVLEKSIYNYSYTINGNRPASDNENLVPSSGESVVGYSWTHSAHSQEEACQNQFVPIHIGNSENNSMRENYCLIKFKQCHCPKNFGVPFIRTERPIGTYRVANGSRIVPYVDSNGLLKLSIENGNELADLVMVDTCGTMEQAKVNELAAESRKNETDQRTNAISPDLNAEQWVMILVFGAFAIYFSYRFGGGTAGDGTE